MNCCHRHCCCTPCRQKGTRPQSDGNSVVAGEMVVQLQQTVVLMLVAVYQAAGCYGLLVLAGCCTGMCCQPRAVVCDSPTAIVCTKCGVCDSVEISAAFVSKSGVCAWTHSLVRASTVYRTAVCGLQ
jgi:hypothetical protein